MTNDAFNTDAQVPLPEWVRQRAGCACQAAASACAHSSRRRFTGMFTGLMAAGTAGALWPAAPAQAQEGADGIRRDVGRNSQFTKLVPAEQVEAAAAQQYNQMMREARNQRALAPDNHPQVVRLRAIANQIVPHALSWNPRAPNWRWEINLIGSKELNAFCMPGGKIAFYFGILQNLQLNDDEVAQIMGHEIAHALREHARERMGKTAATQIGAGLLSSLLGLGAAGDTLMNMGGQLLTLRFSREDESEADLVGMDLGARAGYDPRAGVTLWQKMGRASAGAPPQWMSTHPSGPSRIAEIEANLPKVAGLYARAPRPRQRFSPPAQGNAQPRR